ncbi:uncharacterized protein LTR77_002430 [Saxophila tyrrhenica]|uniref:Uncharacterized protein n=1 Tax=Saxophila tyrrhenica TaxID=1690608 RepID=A0AAV9PJ63_9PEZI|nr:hypothetical protein LTR77_002430 [Saxophila tyrrhenica]
MLAPFRGVSHTNKRTRPPLPPTTYRVLGIESYNKTHTACACNDFHCFHLAANIAPRPRISPIYKQSTEPLTQDEEGASTAQPNNTSSDNLPAIDSEQETDLRFQEIEDWLREHGAVFRNHAGQGVTLDDLDWDIRAGVVEFFTRHLASQAEGCGLHTVKLKWVQGVLGPFEARFHSEFQSERRDSVVEAESENEEVQKARKRTEKGDDLLVLPTVGFGEDANQLEGETAPEGETEARPANPISTLEQATSAMPEQPESLQVFGIERVLVRTLPGIEKFLHPSKLRTKTLSALRYKEALRSRTRPTRQNREFTPVGHVRMYNSAHYPLEIWVEDRLVGSGSKVGAAVRRRSAASEVVWDPEGVMWKPRRQSDAGQVKQTLSEVFITGTGGAVQRA